MIEEFKQLIAKERLIINSLRSNISVEEKQIHINSLRELNSSIPHILNPEPVLKNTKDEPEKDKHIKLEKTKKSQSSFLASKTLAKISNKIFITKSEKLIPQFTKTGENLKKANVSILLQTYISIIFFMTLLSFVSGFIIYGLLVTMGLIQWTYFWAPLVFTGLTFGAFLLYPGSEASNIQKQITNELPFVTIHMAAIAGSDMEPTKIFRIIALSKEYKNIGKELKKVLAQINIYGYDLLTALTNVSKNVSNKKLAELLAGFVTNISSGGSLKKYLERKAETYLLDYKFERKNYIEMAGTFMDIYISILIAAPLILMLMFIIMSVADLNVGGLSLNSLLFLTIGVVIILNIVFIVVLNLKQPQL